MSTSETSPKQNSRGNRGKRGGNRGRGGDRGRGGRQNNQDKAPLAEKPTVTVEAPIVAEPSEAGDGEVCWICAEPVKYYAVSQCNHRTCHVCALRLRALYKRTDCTFCKEPQETVIFTASPDALYDSYSPDSMPHRDAKLAILFESQDIMEETLILLRFNCPDSACDYIGNGWGDLKLHVRATHGRVLCDLCIRFKKVFAHEHVLYPPNVLPIHLPSMHQRGPKSVSPDKVEGGVHPLCEFCKECFFSSDELYPHMRERHEECFICKRNEVRDQYFQNYEHLEKHFNGVHFPCPQKECQARKFVVFNSALDLKAHMVDEHGADMSARDRKDARRVQAEFTFEDPPAQRSGRQGGRQPQQQQQQQQQQQAPRPQPSAAQAQPGGSRRAAFGGNLTAALPAQSSSRVTPVASRSSTPPEDTTRDPAVLERHAVFMSRLEALAGNSTNAVPAVRAAARGYKSSEASARDFISTVWNVLDHNLDSTASIVNAFVDLLDEEDKKQDMLASWRGFAVEHRRQFPDLVPTAVGSGYAGITSGRVLNAKNTTAARSHQQSSRQVLDRIARVANSSGTVTTAIVGSASSSAVVSGGSRIQAERFPPLSGTAPSSSAGFRQPRRTTPWSSAASSFRGPAVEVRGNSNSRPAVTSGGNRPPPPKLSKSAFPELPSARVQRAQKPHISGNVSLKNILGTTGAPQQGSAWGEGSSNGFEADSAPEAEAAPPTTGKGKKKGKQKQTLFTLANTSQLHNQTTSSFAPTAGFHSLFNTPLVQLRSQAGVDFHAMSTTKPVIPVTNLKERIAALEQKNAADRSTSPSPAVGPAAGAGALKDRIAKFEKKGAVPAPRGRFGLGAPPPLEAQIKRNGELYGNRIPQPVRFASGGSQPPSRSGSSIGFYNGSPELNFSDMSNRRSFSLNVAVDGDDTGEYTPLTSPTFSSPPDSPESTLPPEGSPTMSTTSEGSSGFKEPIRRAAPFAQVLENARRASEKTEALENMNDPVSPTPFVNSRRVVKQADVDIAVPTPVPQSRPAPPASTTFAKSNVTEEPASILETLSEPKATPITAPTIVVESPAPSPAAIVEVAPRANATASSIPPQQPVATRSSTLPLETSRPLPSAPSTEELEKPKVRNNKDLTLNLEEVEPTHTSPTSEDENVTPTTANQLLSPAPNSAMSSVFSGSSYGSGGSSMISPRPFSMIDISLAERVTPATGRGNIVFVPPSTATMPRKTDLVYFPPTPTELVRADETPEPSPQVPQTTSFSAVVHEKVKETPDTIPHPAALVPQTPTNRKTKAHSDNKKWKRMTMMAPPTPMTGELASLIHNAVILETMVEKGELPWEAEAREERERERREREEERLAAIAAERAKAAADDSKRKAALEAALVKQREREKARVQAEKEEEEFVTNKLRHTFLIPLSQAQNEHQQTHRKESSTSTINAKANRKTMIEKPSEVPEVPHHPTKSPSIASSKSRFSTFRRLGSVKSVISGRPSDVSMSEDTRSLDSGNYSIDEFGAAGGHGKESSWPSLSPTGKKSMGRASSFAGKMFSRSRTKSSGSTLSNASMNETEKYTLPPLPDFIPQPPESQASKGPRKSTSMKSLRGLVKKNAPPPMSIPAIPHAANSTNIPTTVVSPSSAGSPSSILSSPGPLKSPDYIGFGTMYPPSDLNARPTSMMSVSSLTSVLPSPLFEEDIFSAFPAVPHHTTTTPQPGNHVSTYGLTPVANGPGAVAATPSFDSSFLSSAAHLKPKGARRGNGAATPKNQTTPLPQ